MRLRSAAGLAMLCLANAGIGTAKAQSPSEPKVIGLPPTPRPVGLPPDPRDIGLPPTPRAIDLPPDPDDIGLPRFPAPLGSSPALTKSHIPSVDSRSMPDSAAGQDCSPKSLASVKTDALQDGRIKIPVTVDGHPLSFLVDTGGAATTITGKNAEDLGLAQNQTAHRLLGVVAGSMMSTYVLSKTFSVGDISLNNLPLYLDNRPLSNADGTLSPDVLRDYDVDIDFVRSTLRLIAPNSCARDDFGWKVTPMVLPMNVTGDGHVRFPVKIDGHEIMATLDTGSSISLVRLKGLTPLSDEPQDPTLFRSVGSYQEFAHPFQSLDFGDVSVRNPPIAVLSDNFAPGLGTDLLLGTNILRHMHFYIAYGRKRIYIVANTADGR
jgi:predicted aspartyl protease